MTQVENQSTNSIRKRSQGSDPLDILVFLIPCLQFIQIRLGGRLSGSDILFLLIFIYFGIHGKFKIPAPVGKKFLILCSLWLASQCVTDFVRHTAYADYSRGWSNIGFTIVNFIVLCTLLYGQPRRLIIYGWGLAAGSVLAFYVSPNIFATDYPWKFGLAFPLNLAVFLLVFRKVRRGHWPVTICVILGLFNIYMGTRNTGGACLATALYLLVTHTLRKKGSAHYKLGTKSIVVLATSLILGAGGILWGYQYVASTGMLGEKARGEFERQSSGRYGVLLGGRTEMLASLPAIYDSPILGHGSWAKDPTYLLAQRQALALMGYENATDVSLEDLEEGYIPTHSYIFGAWVSAGILGALFWGWVFVLIVKSLMRIYPATVVLLPIGGFAAFSLFWDLLFSPYGAEMRIISPYYIVMVMTCAAMAPGEAAVAVTSIANRKNAGFTPQPSR